MSRRIVLPCVLVPSVPPTCFRSAGFTAIPPRAKPSSAYTSPLAAADAALPVRASCARQSRGNEVEVIQVTCMLLQFIRFRVRKQKEPRLGGMAGEMNSPHCRPGDAEHRKPFRPPLGRDSRQAENSVRIGRELRKRLCSGRARLLLAPGLHVLREHRHPVTHHRATEGLAARGRRVDRRATGGRSLPPGWAGACK